MITKFLITGVGGQGTILASSVLAEVGVRLGHDVKKSDILGLAVRGGSVISNVCWGERVYSPIIDRGQADYYLSFEWLEGKRNLRLVKPSGVILANDCRLDPISVSSGRYDYPSIDGIKSDFAQAAATVKVVEGTGQAIKLGNVRAFNSVLMGALAAIIGGDSDVWTGVIADLVPPRARDLNVKAYEIGRTLV